MSRDARIELDFADGSYSFRLGWGELATLQEECDAGPYVILHRLHGHQWRMGDISNVIRLGLIGGGMAAADALRKVRNYVEKHPPLESHPFAIAILSAGLLGAPEEPVGGTGAASSGSRIDDLPNGKIRLAAIYGAGAAMGFTPKQVNEMSMWQFMAAFDGYAKANGAQEKMSNAEADELWNWLQSKE